MRFREKALILLVAICVSVMGFNLIASSSVCLLKTARESGYESIRNYLMKCENNYDRSESSARKALKLKQPATDLQSLSLKASQHVEEGDSSKKHERSMNPPRAIETQGEEPWI